MPGVGLVLLGSVSSGVLWRLTYPSAAPLELNLQLPRRVKLASNPTHTGIYTPRSRSVLGSRSVPFVVVDIPALRRGFNSLFEPRHVPAPCSVPGPSNSRLTLRVQVCSIAQHLSQSHYQPSPLSGAAPTRYLYHTAS
ncbi:hypothetical protein B0H10DRAFT_2208411 [Mycena sp. CBHHK59/15]|nr:hypothetical protein B0H10DRAFT_2208411 [Mycena sp. CBHHK59/15]